MSGPTQRLPKLWIVAQDLWDAVKTRQLKVKQNTAANGENAIWERRRARYLLSSLTCCRLCGGGFSMISATHVGRSTARDKGHCQNRKSIKRVELEERVLNALKSKLMDPALFGEFCDEFARK